MNVSRYSRIIQISRFGHTTKNGARKHHGETLFLLSFQLWYDTACLGGRSCSREQRKILWINESHTNEVLVKTYKRQLSPRCNSNPSSHTGSGYYLPLLSSGRGCNSPRKRVRSRLPPSIPAKRAFTRYGVVMNGGKRRLCMIPWVARSHHTTRQQRAPVLTQKKDTALYYNWLLDR